MRITLLLLSVLACWHMVAASHEEDCDEKLPKLPIAEIKHDREAEALEKEEESREIKDESDAKLHELAEEHKELHHKHTKEHEEEILKGLGEKIPLIEGLKEKGEGLGGLGLHGKKGLLGLDGIKKIPEILKLPEEGKLGGLLGLEKDKLGGGLLGLDKLKGGHGILDLKEGGKDHWPWKNLKNLIPVIGHLHKHGKKHGKKLDLESIKEKVEEMLKWATEGKDVGDILTKKGADVGKCNLDGKSLGGVLGLIEKLSAHKLDWKHLLGWKDEDDHLKLPLPLEKDKLL